MVSSYKLRKGFGGSLSRIVRGISPWDIFLVSVPLKFNLPADIFVAGLIIIEYFYSKTAASPLRILTIILSLYITAISFVPCSDEPPHVDEQGAGHYCAQLSAHAHEEDFGEACSPFCLCSCCQQTVDQHRVTLPALFYVVTATHFKNPVIKQLSVQQLTIDLFRPPRTALI